MDTTPAKSDAQSFSEEHRIASQHGMEFAAYRISANAPSIVPAGPKRQWMDNTPFRFAYRCLPMLLANQAGWLLLNPHPVRVKWWGGKAKELLTIKYIDEPPPNSKFVVSVFGCGIVT